MKKFLSDFRAFVSRGSVIDLAVGVIIGAAFQNIVSSLVKDILSPLLGTLGSTDFSAFSLVIRGVEIRYGAFVTAILNFLIMAFVVFLLVKTINKLNFIGKTRAPKAPTTKACPFCCNDIPIAATRCPHCTSLLEESPTNS